MVSARITSANVSSVIAVPTEITFSTTNWEQEQTITISGAEDANTEDETVIVTNILDIVGSVSKDVEVTTIDDDAYALIIQAPDTIDEGTTDIYTINLGSAPTATITVNISSNNISSIVTSPPNLTFTTTNWDQLQNVTLTAIEDNNIIDDVVSIAHTSEGNDSDLTIRAIDNDVIENLINIIVSTTTITVNEGTASTYTIKLDNQPSTVVSARITSANVRSVIAVPTEITFSTTNWDLIQTVTLTAFEDPNNENESVTITNSLDVAFSIPTYVTVKVTDNDTLGLVIVGDLQSIEENTTEVYAVSLFTGITQTITVVIASENTTSVIIVGKTILTFTATNWNDPQTVTLMAVEDDNSINDYVNIRHSAEGNRSAITVRTIDNDVARLLLSTDILTIHESTNRSYSVSLTTDPTRDVVVRIISSNIDVTTSGTLTFTINDWDQPQMVYVTAQEDDDNTATEVVTITNIADSNYDNASAIVTVTTIDNDTAANLTGVLDSGASIYEGETFVYTISFSRELDAADTTLIFLSSNNTNVAKVTPTTLSYSDDSWHEPQQVSLYANILPDIYDTQFILSIFIDSFDLNFDGIIIPTATINVINVNEGIRISKDIEDPATRHIVNVGEGESATYTITLATQPVSRVLVSTIIDSIFNFDNNVDITSNRLTFTAMNWDIAQTINVISGEDANTFDEVFNITYIASSNDSFYEGITSEIVRVTSIDNDIVNPIVSPTNISLDEYSTAIYTVNLNLGPYNTVALTISSDNPNSASVSVDSLLFTMDNWMELQTVTITAVNDTNHINETVTITNVLSDVSGSVPAVVVVAINDIDRPNSVLSATADTITEETAKNYTIVLSEQPRTTLAVTITSNNTASVTVSPEEFMFSVDNWNEAQSITITAINDNNVLNEDVVITSVLGVADSIDDTLIITAIDNDTLAPVFSRTTDFIAEGATNTYTIKLGAQHTSDIVVAITSDNAASIMIGPETATFTITNWDQPQVITIYAREDANFIDEVINVVATTDVGNNFSTLVVTIIDDEAIRLELSTTTITIDEGSVETYSVVLSMQPDSTNLITTAIMTSGSGVVIISPETLMFTVDNWDSSQTITLTGAADDDTINESTIITHSLDASNAASTFLTVIVNDTSVVGFNLPTEAVFVIEGEIASYPISLTAEPYDSVTVAIESNDNSVISIISDSLTFTETNWNIAQNITISAGIDINSSAESVVITHSAVGADFDNVSANITVVTVDIDSLNIQLSTKTISITEGLTGSYTIVLKIEPAHDVVIMPLISPNPDSVSVISSLTFTQANWDMVQTITIESVGDDIDRDNVNVVISHQISSDDTNYANLVIGDIALTIINDDVRGIIINIRGGVINLPDDGTVGSYAIRLSTEPVGDDVVIMVESASTADFTLSPTSLTFTTTNWNINQSIFIDVVVDNIINPDREVTITYTVTSVNSDYANLAPVHTIATIRNDDVVRLVQVPIAHTNDGIDTTVYFILGAQPTDPDDATITVNLSIASENYGLAYVTGVASIVAGNPLLFSPSNWNVPQAVKIHIEDDIQSQIFILFNDSISTSNGSFANPDAIVGVQVRIEEIDTASVNITPLSLLINKGSIVTYNVVLDKKPHVDDGNIVIDITNNSSNLTESPSILTFTADNWNITQTVTLTEADVDGVLGFASITHTIEGNSSDDIFSYRNSALVVPAVDVHIVDDRFRNIIQSISSMNTFNENQTQTYKTRLSKQPVGGDVTLTLRSSLPDFNRTNHNYGIIITPTELTFTETNWDQEQVVTFFLKVDDDNDMEKTVTIISEASGADYDGVSSVLTIYIVDNQSINLSSAYLIINEGETAAYSINITSKPNDEVVVRVMSDNTSSVVSPEELTFSVDNWNTEQTITITVAHDINVIHEIVSINHLASGGDCAGVNKVLVLDVVDDDMPTLNIITSSINKTNNGTSEINEGEGESAVYTVNLTTRPIGGAVMISASSDNSSLVGVSSYLLTFNTTNWDQAQTLTIIVTEDDNAVSETVIITNSASSSGDYDGVSAGLQLIINDDETAAINQSADNITIKEGEAITYTLSLASEPVGDTVVVTASSANTAIASTLSTRFTFTQANWRNSQTITITAGKDANTDDSSTIITNRILSTSDYEGISSIVIINITDVLGFNIPVKTISVNEGSAGEYAISLTYEPAGDVVITPTSNDTRASVAGALTFTPTNWNMLQTIVVTVASNDSEYIGGIVAITNSATGADYDGISENIELLIFDNDTTLFVTNWWVTDDDKIITIPTFAQENYNYDIDWGDGSIERGILGDRLHSYSVAGSYRIIISGVFPGININNYDDKDKLILVEQWGDVQLSRVDNAFYGASNLELSTINAPDLTNVTSLYRMFKDASKVNTDLSNWNTSNINNMQEMFAGATSFNQNISSWDISSVTNMENMFGETGLSSSVVLSAVNYDALLNSWSAQQTANNLSFSAGNSFYTLVGATARDNLINNKGWSITDGGLRYIVLSTTTATIIEGATDTYTINLGAQPSSDVIVSAISDNSNISLSSSVFTFTQDNWDLARTVTINTSEDFNHDTETSIITHTASGDGYNGIYIILTITSIDNDTPSIITLLSTNDIIEDGDALSYNIRLATEPSGDVTVTTASSDLTAVSVVALSTLIFTQDNWNIDQTITLQAVSDDDAADEVATLTSVATGANYAGVSVSVVFNVIDDDEPLIFSENTIVVDEGTSTIYEITLALEPTADVVVALSVDEPSIATINPVLLTFAINNWDTVQTITVAGIASADLDSKKTQIQHILSSVDTRYHTLIRNIALDVINVDKAIIISINEADIINEGFSASYNIKLTTKPSGDVMVASISNNEAAVGVVGVKINGFVILTFTQDNWNVAQTLALLAPNDDNAIDEVVTIAITATGGGYDNVGINVIVGTVDDDDTINISTTNITVNEGDSAEYMVMLSLAPSSDVVITIINNNPNIITISPDNLTFTASNWDTMQTVSVESLASTSLADLSTQIEHASSSEDSIFSNLLIGAIVVNVINIDKGIITPTSDTVTESNNEVFYGMQLSIKPSGNVVVTASVSGSNTAITTIAMRTFTPDNWAEQQFIGVVFFRDDNAIDEVATITFAATGADYAGITSRLIVNIIDRDTAALDLSATLIILNENGSFVQYQIKLDTEPSSNVVVANTSNNPDINIIPASLIFTTSNWDSNQNVAVYALQDDNIIDETATIIATATGGSYDGVHAEFEINIIDNNEVGIYANTNITVLEDDVAIYEVVLTGEPNSNVVVSISIADLSIVSVDVNTLTFSTTNWDSVQTVLVSGIAAPDLVTKNTELSYVLSFGDVRYNGLTDIINIYVLNTDKGIITSASEVDIEEAQHLFYDLKLATKPSGDVMLANISNNAAAGVVGVKVDGFVILTFTSSNWDVVQSLSLFAPNDDNAVNEVVTIVTTATGGGYEGITASVIVNVKDNDEPLSFNKIEIVVDEGATTDYEVSLSFEPTAEVIVALAVDEPIATISPAMLTFTNANWSTVQIITVTGTTSADLVSKNTKIQHSLSSSDTNHNSLTFSINLNVVNIDKAIITSVSEIALNENGAALNYNIRLTAKPSADVVVTTVTSDNSSVDIFTIFTPRFVTFTPVNWNLAQEVSIYAFNDADTIDEVVNITSSATGGGYDGISAVVIARVNDNDSARLILKTLTNLNIIEGSVIQIASLKLSSQPSSDVVVSNTSSNPDLTVTAAFTFTVSNWNSEQLIEVQAAEDNNAVDEVVTITITATGADYDGLSTSIAINIIDNDEPLNLSHPNISINEGFSATYTITLSIEPSANVVVALSIDDLSVATISSAMLTFTNANWSTTQTITIVGTASADLTSKNTKILHNLSSADINYNDVVSTVFLNIINIDKGIITSISEGSLNEGASALYNIRLVIEPSGDVMLTSVSSDLTVVDLSNAILTFTQANWEQTQQIFVTANNNDSNNGDNTASITSTATGGGYEGLNVSVIFNVIDDDVAHAILSTTVIYINKDSTQAYTIKLATEPHANVEVEVLSNDTSIVAIISDNLTFTIDNWGLSQTVLVSALMSSSSNNSVAISHTLSSLDSFYNNLAVDNVVVNVRDIILSTTSFTINEADNEPTYDVRLSHPPSSNVTITTTSSDELVVTLLNSSNLLTFTNDNWDTSQTITLQVASDDDAATEVATLTSVAIGGGYNVRSSVVVSVIDDETAELVLAPTDTVYTINEGDDLPFTIKLANPPNGTVTVTTITNNAIAIIPSSPVIFTPSDWDTFKNVPLSSTQDNNIIDDIVMITFIASGSNYEGVSYSITANIIDDDEVGIHASATSLAINESGENSTTTYVLTLTGEPRAPVVIEALSSNTNSVTISPSALTFVQANWESNQTFVVSGVYSADLEIRNSQISHNVISIDSVYSNFNIANITVDVANIDKSLVSTLTNTNTFNINEGSVLNYSLKLASKPNADVIVTTITSDEDALRTQYSLTFTATNWNINQLVVLQALEDVDAHSEVVFVTSTTSANYDNVSVSAVVSITDNDDPDIYISTDNIIINEGSSVAYEVTILREPSANVTVFIASNDQSIASVSPNVLIFTPANWTSAHMVTINGVVSANLNSLRTELGYTLTSDDNVFNESYVANTVVDVINVELGIIASVSEISVIEGVAGDLAIFYDIKLATVPSADVVVAATSDNSDIAVIFADRFRTFTPDNWDMQQAVRLIAFADDDTIDETAIITNLAQGADYGGVSTTIVASAVDTDEPLVFSESSIVVDEGTSTIYTVALSFTPSHNVIVDIAVVDLNVATISPSNLTFTLSNWDATQTVSVTGLASPGLAIASTQIEHTLTSADTNYNGVLSIIDLEVLNADKAIIASVGLASLQENGAALTYNIKLASKPMSAVTVTSTSSIPSSVDIFTQFTPRIVTFTPVNWNLAQEVSIVGVEDANAIDENVVITSAGNGDYSGITTSVNISVEDNDVIGLILSTSAITVVEDDAAITYTIKLATEPSGNVVVT